MVVAYFFHRIQGLSTFYIISVWPCVTSDSPPSHLKDIIGDRFPFIDAFVIANTSR